MLFSFYIARRYLISKKSHNIINIISGISIAGVTVGTMALIIVLSVFNGFQQLVISLFNSFNPDLVITASVGKVFDTKSFPEEKIRQIPGVVYLGEYIEENALVRYKERQYIVTVKGVEPDYARISGLDTMMSEGKFILHDDSKDFAVLGYGVAYSINANLDDYLNPISIYVPKRTAGYSGSLEGVFNNEVIFPSGFFSIQQDFDSKYVILPLDFTRKLLDYDTQVSGIELWLNKKTDPEKIQKEVVKIAGKGVTVKNRYQQQAILYKIMKSEKWAIFMILAFILFIATFNVIGSLSMLILDKKQDIAVLQSMGATQRTVRAIFLAEGMLISLIGAITGLILGGLICKLQQVYGFVKLGSPGSTFVVNSYPVAMNLLDFIFVFLTVALIGLMATWYPVYNIRKIDTHILNLRS